MNAILNVVQHVPQNGLVKQRELLSGINVEVSYIIINSYIYNNIYISIGKEYLGPTKCVDGVTCFKRSEWYSHCTKNCPNDDTWECWTKNQKN
jgi:hypothetical protein